MYRKIYSGENYLRLRFLLLLVILFFASTISAQTVSLKGTVNDQETGRPLSFVSVVLKNTLLGTNTDTLGRFKLSYKLKVDSAIFTAIGYVRKAVALPVDQPAIELQVNLKADNINLSEVKILPDDGPVRRVLKEMISRKKQNNPDKYQRYSYRKYTKWEYHLNNIGPKFMDSKAFRNNKSVFKTNADSSKYLPIYFSEQLVYNEVQRNPLKQKSTVLADRTSGLGVLDDYEISGYTSALDMEVNFYDNYINLFYQNFVSPLADNGWFYYRYFLSDSTELKGHKIYSIRFIPRRAGDKVFKGYMTTDTKNYALIDIDGTLANANYLNFMKSMRLKESFQMVNDSTPFYRRNQIDAVFDYVPIKNNPSKKPINLFFSQSSVIDSVSVGNLKEIKLELNNGHYETIKLPDAKVRDQSYWDKHRLEELDSREKEMAATIDSVSQIKFVKVADNIARMSMTGYYDLGRYEFGPFMNVLNTNKVEGVHVFAGARTSDEISTRYMVWGGLGYGFRNKKVNGIAGVGYKFPTIHRQLAKLSYDDKIVRAGENEKILFLYENALTPTENNLVSQVFKRDELDELFREQRLASSYEYEWYPGLMNKLSANYIRHFSPEFYPFLRNGNPVNYVTAADFCIDTRFSWKEKVIDDKFLRVYMSTDYPIIHLALGGGKVYYSGKENYYGRIFSTIEQYVMIGQTGFNYALEGGMYLGKLPYTMLDIPRGNETFGYYSYDFNMLNFMEYVHDKYFHAYLEYHLNGFLLNRLPLLKKSMLREVFSSKIMMGSLSDKHQQIVEFPNGITKMTNPYVELGAGVENILRLFRLEAVWRVTPKSTLGAPSFGLRAKFEIKL